MLFFKKLCRVVRAFKLNLLIFKKKNLVKEWKVPSVESVSLLIIGILQNFMFLEDLTKLPYFIECNLTLGLIEGIHIKVVQKKLLHWDLG